MHKLKRIIFLTIVIALFIHLTGFFSKPTIEYWIYIGLPQNCQEVKNVEILLPYPFYRGKPLPFYKGTYIKEIFPAIKTAAKTKDASVEIVKNEKYGQMLKINISRMSKDKNDKIEISFVDHTSMPNFFTPLIFLSDLQKIYFLSPIRQKWFWKNEKYGFSAQKYTNTFIHTNFEGKAIDIGLSFKFKKRLFLGHILVEEEVVDEKERRKSTITKQGWIKCKIKEKEEMKFY